MMQFIHNHPWYFGIGVWAVLAAGALFFNYACSVVSGNHEDPYRDEGQC